MSVQFTATTGPTTGHQVSCLCVSGPILGDFADARALADSMLRNGERLDGCTDDVCVEYGPSVERLEDDPAPLIDTTSLNGVLLLDALGLSTDLPFGGQVTGEDLLGRVLMAQAVAPTDAGTPAHSAPGPGASWIDCGRRPNYLQDRLADLHALAEFSIRTGRDVIWY